MTHAMAPLEAFLAQSRPRDKEESKMTPKVGNSWVLPALVLLSALVVGCGSKPAGDAPLASDADCKSGRAWIDNPSQPAGSKFDPNSNCSFHQWSYQTFLWLVSKDPMGEGALVFEGFADPKNLLRPGGPGDTPYPGRAAGDSPTMLARMAKSRTTADIDNIFQAGPGNKALIDQAGNIVYYSNHLNQQYWDFAIEKQLYDVEVLKRIDPGLDFPVDGLELKSSWRIAQIGDQVPIIPDAEKRYFVVSAHVPRVAPNEKGILVEDKKNRIAAKMALIGMHVVGIVKGHKEFIWATFEHVDNAPNCADIPPKNAEGKTWNLYDGKASRATANQFNVGDPMAVVNVCLTHPDGGGTNENKSAIQTLNASVQALLGDSLWSNYTLGGAVWTSGQVPVNNGAFTPADIAAGKPTQLGSIDLANTTMETFTQDQNCFACHNGGAHELVVGGQATEVKPKIINLSHFVVNYQATQQVAGN